MKGARCDSGWSVVEDRAEAEVLALDLLRSLTLLWHVTVLDYSNSPKWPIQGSIFMKKVWR